MHGRWQVGRFPDEVWIVRSFGGDLPPNAIVIAPDNAAFRVDEWFPEGGGSQRILAAIQEELGAPLVTEPRLSASRLRAVVRAGLRAGSLKAYRIHVTLSGGAVLVDPEPPRPPEPPKPDETTFIAIELVDDADPPNPVPFTRYRIELPDASVREGMLDASGKARISGIDPGTCKVSFPQLDGNDWKLG